MYQGCSIIIMNSLKIVKMLLDEANGFVCAPSNDMAFKMIYFSDSFEIILGYSAFVIHVFQVLLF
jgi:hypothetical protein